MNERQMLRVRLLGWMAGLLLSSAALAAPGSTSLRIEELTWTELSDRIAAGSTTVLVPIGGTEQNGPHMVLGKHNVRVNALAVQIAKTLGNAVVAPVLAYVPEGSIEPPVAHMRFTGTISIPESAFEAVLESTARCSGEPKCRHTFSTAVEITSTSAPICAARTAAARSLSITAATPLRSPFSSATTGMPPPPAAITT